MKPVNNKSLLHFIFDQMDKLDKKEITVDDAKAQASLAKQANNSMMFELELARTKVKVDEYNKSSKSNIEIRIVETKIFDQIPIDEPKG